MIVFLLSLPVFTTGGVCMCTVWLTFVLGGCGLDEAVLDDIIRDGSVDV